MREKHIDRILLIAALLVVILCGCGSIVIFSNDMIETNGVSEQILDITQSNIDDGVQIVVENIKEYRQDEKIKNSDLSESELDSQTLSSIGYSPVEINQMSDDTKAMIASSNDIVVQRTSSSTNVGLNMTVTYFTKTLILPVNYYTPVDYYFVNVIWSWATPDSLIGSPDFIGINIDDSKDYYSLLALEEDSDLGKYEYCNFHYNRKVYNGTIVTTDYYLQGECGEYKKDTSTRNRTLVLQMPKNEIEYDVPSESLTYKTIYTDFEGEAQFVLDINAETNESFSQYIGVTYGHACTEYTATYSTTNSVSVGVSADVQGVSLAFGAQTSSGWTYTETEKIVSTSTRFLLSYSKINIVDGKVYNLVNLGTGRPLEYAGCVTTSGTPLRVGDISNYYAADDEKYQNASWQWRVEFNANTNGIVIHPIADEDKHIEFNSYNEATLAESPKIMAYSNLTGALRVAPYSYTIPQHNIQIANCYKIQGGTDYGYVMNCKSDFYTTVTYGQIGSVDEARSSWGFYEVPDEYVADVAPLDAHITANSVFRMKNVGTGRYMDVCNASIDYGADLLVYDRGDGYNQQFKLVQAGNGNYFIEPYHVLGFNLDVPDGNQASGQQIKTYGYNGYTAQQFRLYPIKSVNGKVQVVISTAVTEHEKALQGNDNLTVTQMIAKKDNDYQLWELEYVGQDKLSLTSSDTYFIRNKASKYYFDVTGAGTKNNTELLQYDFSGATNQTFKFSRYWEGSYYMIPQHATDKVVELKGESVNGYRLKLYSKRDDKPYQRYKFVRASSDSFYILTGASGYSKAVAVGGDVNIHNPLEQWDRTNTDAQQWVIEKNNTLNTGYIYERCLTKLNVTTSAQSLAFSPSKSGSYTIETVGGIDTTIKLYEQSSDSTYVLKVTSTNGGVKNNAKLTVNLVVGKRYKVEIYGNNSSGVAGVIAHE